MGSLLHRHASPAGRGVPGPSPRPGVRGPSRRGAARQRRRAPSPPGDVPLTGALALTALLVVYNWATNLTPQDDHRYIVRNALVGLLLVAMARHRGLTWDELGLGRGRLRTAWRHGVVSAGTVAAGVALASVLGQRRPLGRRLLSDRRADLDDRELAWQTLVRIPVGTAAFEEVVFRGVLHGLLGRAGGGLAAVGGASAAFGLWHIGPALAALRHNGVDSGLTAAVAASVAATAVAGLGFGSLRVSGGHVLPCWLAHWTSNAVGLLVAARWHRSRGTAALRAVAEG